MTVSQVQSDLASVVIIGGGMSGFTAANELRQRGFNGRVTIVDPEGVPYDRPPLSKDYLLGHRLAPDIYLSPADWYGENKVEIITGKAVSLDAENLIVSLEDGTQLQASAVVLANGGAARRLPAPGGDLDTVLQLRDLADADRLRSLLTEGTRLTIIGAGLIGAETASVALTFGAEVTLIDPVEVPLVPAVGERLAQRLHHMHSERGIYTITGVPSEITRDDGGAHQILLQDGSVVEADVVLVGIGIVPRTELADHSGFEIDNGIVVDEAQRTGVPGVYAVGDVSRTRLADGTLLRRAEHWENAMFTGQTAAAAILDQELPRRGASWFWSDRHGVHVEGVGTLSGDGTRVHRETDGVPTTTFLLNADGTLAGCAAIDSGLTVRAARRIIDRGIIVEPGKLADPSVPLKKLAK